MATINQLVRKPRQPWLTPRALPSDAIARLLAVVDRQQTGTGAYLIGQSPSFGPIAGPIVATIGAVNFLGGVILEVGAGYLGYEFFIKPDPRIPAGVPKGR